MRSGLASRRETGAVGNLRAGRKGAKRLEAPGLDAISRSLTEWASSAGGQTLPDFLGVAAGARHDGPQGLRLMASEASPHTASASEFPLDAGPDLRVNLRVELEDFSADMGLGLRVLMGIIAEYGDSIYAFRAGSEGVHGPPDQKLSTVSRLPTCVSTGPPHGTRSGESTWLNAA